MKAKVTTFNAGEDESQLFQRLQEVLKICRSPNFVARSKLNLIAPMLEVILKDTAGLKQAIELYEEALSSSCECGMSPDTPNGKSCRYCSRIEKARRLACQAIGDYTES